MCDCYMHECENCGCGIAMHIGDYSTDRESVTVYCTACALLFTKKTAPKAHFVSWEKVTRKGQVEGGRVGAEVLILCNDPKGYSIHLN